jgi:hypothetical protein
MAALSNGNAIIRDRGDHKAAYFFAGAGAAAAGALIGVSNGGL